MSGSSRTTCPHYDEVDAILGTRAASQPTILLDSGGGEQSVNTDVDIGMLPEFGPKSIYIYLYPLQEMLRLAVSSLFPLPLHLPTLKLQRP